MREIKSCLLCSSEFIQAKPPKAVQVYCSYQCYLKAKVGGDNPVHLW